MKGTSGSKGGARCLCAITGCAIAVMLVATIGWADRALAESVGAAPPPGGVLELEPARTRVAFTLGGALHTVHGTFQLKRGTLTVNTRTGDAAGLVVVDATSAESGNSLRDSRMRDSVLEVQTYPEITFSPQHADVHVDNGGMVRGRIEGALTLHGAAHPVVIETQATVVGDRLDATARFTVPYVEWGLQDPSVVLLSVAKQVEIDVTATGQVTWFGGTPPAR